MILLLHFLQKTAKTTKKPPKKPDSVTATALVIVSVQHPSSDTSPSSYSVLVETVSTRDKTKLFTSASTGTTTLSENPGETVPAPLGVGQVYIMGGSAAFASTSTTGTTKDSTKNEDEEKNAPADKKPSNDDSARNDDKKNNKKKNDKSGPAVPPTIDDFSTLECRFIFDADLTRPLLAEIINISYDLSFDPKIFFYSDGSLQNNPDWVLRNKIWYIFSNQVNATGPRAANTTLFSSSTSQLIIKTITDSFTFSGDLVKSKGLIKTQQSLYQVLIHAVRQRFPSFTVYIPTLHLYLTDESGLLLPPEHWDQLNLVYFLEPISYTPFVRVGDILPRRSSVDRLAEVVEGYVQSAHQRPYKDPSRSSELPDPVVDLDIYDLPDQVCDRVLLS